MPFTRLGQIGHDPLEARARDLKPLPWADETQAAAERYRAAQPSDADLARVDNYEITPLEYFENAHLRVRALENELGFMYRNWITTVEQQLDEATACKVAYAAGLSHGKRRMGKFLTGHKQPGGPESMAMLQDYGHSSAGPRHATALFARYDDGLVEVSRTEDSYGAHTGEESAVVKAFFDGFADGYMATDPRLKRVEEMTRARADGRTEFVHRFWYEQ